MLKEIYWGPGRETHVLLRRPRFLGHPSTTFFEHTFLHLLPSKLGFSLLVGEEFAFMELSPEKANPNLPDNKGRNVF